MSKDFLAINSGRVILTKYNPQTGALSTDPKDKRICTETCDKITRKKSLKTYEIPDGSSNYPAGSYETGVTYNVGINFTTLNSATLAFLQNAEIKNASGNIKELAAISIPTESPYKIKALGNIVGTPTILDSECNPFAKVEITPSVNQFKVTAGTSGTKQSMTKTVTTKASTAGTATATIIAAGSAALASGKAVTVNLTTVDVNTNASEIRSALKADNDISAYFDIGGTAADVVLTRKSPAAAESEAFNFALVTAVGAVLGTTTSVPGVASTPSEIEFHASDAGKPITTEYVFEAPMIESYDIDENHINPVVQIEIIHETLSKDKMKRYKNNSIISRAQLTGDIDENLARQHESTMLNFLAIKPVGTKVINNKKTEIPLI